MALILKRVVGRGAVKYYASFASAGAKVGNEGEPGTFRLSFNGINGQFFVHGNEDDAKELILKLADLIYTMKRGGRILRRPTEREASILMLEEIINE